MVFFELFANAAFFIDYTRCGMLRSAILDFELRTRPRTRTLAFQAEQSLSFLFVSFSKLSFSFSLLTKPASLCFSNSVRAAYLYLLICARCVRRDLARFVVFLNVFWTCARPRPRRVHVHIIRQRKRVPF